MQRHLPHAVGRVAQGGYPGLPYLRTPGFPQRPHLKQHLLQRHEHIRATEAVRRTGAAVTVRIPLSCFACRLVVVLE